MTSLTPVKIRGKRHVAEAAKWHAGKRRKIYREDSVTPSEGSFSALSSSSNSSRRKRRKRREPELSRLEQLPTEILQTIFEFSGNVDFALVSPKLASQLSGAGRHLHHQLTSQILQPILAVGSLTDNDPAEYAAVARFMNSKFFTWPFFKDWLEEEFERRDLLGAWQEELELSHDYYCAEDWPKWTWLHMWPAPALRPPKKLLRSPFTNDKISLLQVLAYAHRPVPYSILSNLSNPVTEEGLREAIDERALEVLKCVWPLGAGIDTELLRYAVIDAGCDKEIVGHLVSKLLDWSLDWKDVDYFDPALWAWAEKAKEKGDEKGPWLIQLLRDASRAEAQEYTRLVHADI